MGIELRKEERAAGLALSEGELFHESSGQHIHVSRVRNISFTGMGLLVEKAVDRGEKVRMGFKYSGGALIQIDGSVVWCTAAEKCSDSSGRGRFMMGVIM